MLSTHFYPCSETAVPPMNVRCAIVFAVVCIVVSSAPAFSEELNPSDLELFGYRIGERFVQKGEVEYRDEYVAYKTYQKKIAEFMGVRLGHPVGADHPLVLDSEVVVRVGASGRITRIYADMKYSGKSPALAVKCAGFLCQYFGDPKRQRVPGVMNINTWESANGWVKTVDLQRDFGGVTYYFLGVECSAPLDVRRREEPLKS